MLSSLMSFFSCSGYPDDVELILMMSAPTTSNEVEMMSWLFDKVLVPASHFSDVVLNSESLASRSNVHSFVLEDFPDGWDSDNPSGVQAARWLVQETSITIAVEQTFATEMKSSVWERKAEVGYIVLGDRSHVSEGARRADLAANSKTSEVISSRSGIICRGLHQQATIWNSRPDFAILRNDKTIKDAIVGAVRSDIHLRLFSRSSGLESY
ncbi:MAG: hypothetical protein J0H71_16870 [Rhizobiales bacterium]|nr:hypothetical protein [Hyphomicrobiales bacterium]